MTKSVTSKFGNGLIWLETGTRSWSKIRNQASYDQNSRYVNEVCDWGDNVKYTAVRNPLVRPWCNPCLYKTVQSKTELSNKNFEIFENHVHFHNKSFS